MRIYVSADIEGVAGVVSPENLSPGRFEYEAARDWMTDAVLTVCEAARSAGAEEVVVSDSHGNGQNIRFERMPDYVQLVRSWPRPLGMMQGVELGPYAGAMLVGYHACATNMRGTLAHTMSGEFFHEIRFNGVVVSEAAISAAIAARFGVPVIMAAGDDVFVEEIQALLGDVSVAALKTSFGRNSALNPSLAVATDRLRCATLEAMARLGRRPAPVAAEGPLLVEIRLRNRLMAEWLAYLPEVERLDAYTVRYACEDVLGASRFLMFLTQARVGLG